MWVEMTHERARRSSYQNCHLVSRNIWHLRLEGHRPVSSSGTAFSWWSCWVAWDKFSWWWHAGDNKRIHLLSLFGYLDDNVGWFNSVQHIITWITGYFAWWVNNMCKFGDPKKQVIPGWSLQIDQCYGTHLSICPA